MRYGRCIYLGALLVALAVGLGLWRPSHVKADPEGFPKFRVDPSWPQPLPAPVGYNPLTWPGCGAQGCQNTATPGGDNVAHRWVQGEVAASCIDANDNVYTFNRGWEGGVGGKDAMSGALNGQDGTPAGALPSPPVVVFNSAGKAIAGWGNPSLDPSTGRATYLPDGAHGCYVDYQGYVWLGGNNDGVIQKYNPVAAAKAGASATYVAQIGTKNVCDTPTGACITDGGTNTSTTLLDDPPDMAVDPLPDPKTGTRGSVYIADGYGNHRVVVYTTTDGVHYTYNRQFGTDCGTSGFGKCPVGTFGHSGGGHPHCVVLANDGLVYTCDRPDSRIEVWTKSGEFVREIPIDNFPTATPAAKAAILMAANRACDMDFYPNIDYLAGLSPTSQKYIVNVDLQSDNTYLLDKVSGAALTAFGSCGLSPCPGHNAGEFAYGHTTAVDSKGNVYIAETITGRRIQKFIKGQGPGGNDNAQH
jgi:hypothetical protein